MGLRIRFANLWQLLPCEMLPHQKALSSMANTSSLWVHDLTPTELVHQPSQSSLFNKKFNWKSKLSTLSMSWALFNRSRMRRKRTAHARLVREEGHWRVLEQLPLSWRAKNRLVVKAYLLLALSTRRMRSLCSVSSQARKSRVLWNHLENQQR